MCHHYHTFLDMSFPIVTWRRENKHLYNSHCVHIMLEIECSHYVLMEEGTYSCVQNQKAFLSYVFYMARSNSREQAKLPVSTDWVVTGVNGLESRAHNAQIVFNHATDAIVNPGTMQSRTMQHRLWKQASKVWNSLLNSFDTRIIGIPDLAKPGISVPCDTNRN